MNFISKILLASITLLLVMSFKEYKSKKYEVEILQDGKPVQVIDNVVNLEKRDFQIRVTLNDQEGVIMSASFNRDYFDLRDEQKIKDYKWLIYKVRIGEEFNEEKELVVDDEFVSYLFYDKETDWHRFDKDVIVNGKKAIGTKTIRKIFVEKTKKVIPLANMDRSIYLFFVATEEWKRDKEPKELGRLKIEIKWK